MTSAPAFRRAKRRQGRWGCTCRNTAAVCTVKRSVSPTAGKRSSTNCTRRRQGGTLSVERGKGIPRCYWRLRQRRRRGGPDWGHGGVRQGGPPGRAGGGADWAHRPQRRLGAYRKAAGTLASAAGAGLPPLRCVRRLSVPAHDLRRRAGGQAPPGGGRPAAHRRRGFGRLCDPWGGKYSALPQ